MVLRGFFTALVLLYLKIKVVFIAEKTNVYGLGQHRLEHVQDDLAQVGVGLHVLVRGLCLL